MLTELPVLAFQFSLTLGLLGVLLGGKLPVFALICRDPVSESGVIETEFPCDMYDRARPIEHHADRFVLELLGVRFLASQLPFPSERPQ
ncbi:hypothetical protein BJF83_23825 [Nocardiopsis sp. CNR-923]|nr:hypothetical protein BJF83_23825 [Nocardiopsis sp. CNR-923]